MLLKKTSLILPFILGIFSLASCVSKKDIAYFQPSSPEDDLSKVEISQKYVPTLQNGDILSIMVSSLSPEASAMFNPYAGSLAITNQSSQADNLAPVSGYLIDDEGFITLPLIGKLKVSELTTKELTQAVTTRLDKYLQQPTVNIRILNFRISVLGEVAKPSVYTIPNEKITLPEAIGLAGDLTIYGQRKNVLIIRENNGKKEFARIDLTKRELFNSPYYFLHANDVVYIEATQGRLTSTDRALQLAPIVLSSLSFLTLVLLNFIK